LGEKTKIKRLSPKGRVKVFFLIIAGLIGNPNPQNGKKNNWGGVVFPPPKCSKNNRANKKFFEFGQRKKLRVMDFLTKPIRKRKEKRTNGKLWFEKSPRFTGTKRKKQGKANLGWPG